MPKPTAVIDCRPPCDLGRAIENQTSPDDFFQNRIGGSHSAPRARPSCRPAGRTCERTTEVDSEGDVACEPNCHGGCAMTSVIRIVHGFTSPTFRRETSQRIEGEAQRHVQEQRNDQNEASRRDHREERKRKESCKQPAMDELKVLGPDASESPGDPASGVPPKCDQYGVMRMNRVVL